MEIKKSDQKHIEELKKNIKYTGPIGKSARIIKFKNKEIHIESVKICINGLRAAHNDARDLGDGFAELLIFNLLHESAEIGWQLARAKEAAK